MSVLNLCRRPSGFDLSSLLDLTLPEVCHRLNVPHALDMGLKDSFPCNCFLVNFKTYVDSRPYPIRPSSRKVFLRYWNIGADSEIHFFLAILLLLLILVIAEGKLSIFLIESKPRFHKDLKFPPHYTCILSIIYVVLYSRNFGERFLLILSSSRNFHHSDKSTIWPSLCIHLGVPLGKREPQEQRLEQRRRLNKMDTDTCLELF